MLPQQPPIVVNNAKATGYADVNGSRQLVQAETNFPTIILTPPVAIFTESNDHPIVNETVTFNAPSSYDPDGHIVKFEWNWEGDRTYDFNAGTNPIATHAYEQPGIYYPTLRVTDNDGLTNETTERKFVSSPAFVVGGYSVSLETAYPQTFSIIYVILVLAVTAASAYLHFRLKHIRISLNRLGQLDESASG
ncbi:MAG: PKD domain-containing protein [Candidatus Bathyarchaeia archaeon]